MHARLMHAGNMLRRMSQFMTEWTCAQNLKKRSQINEAEFNHRSERQVWPRQHGSWSGNHGLTCGKLHWEPKEVPGIYSL